MLAAPAFFKWRGDRCSDVRNWDPALRNYDLAIRLGLWTPAKYLGRARARYNRGELDEAIQDLEEAIERTSNLGHLNYFYIDRGLRRSSQHDFDGAIADFDRAIEIDPGHKTPRTYRYRASARLRKGDREGALSDFQQYIELTQGSAGRLYHPHMVGVPPPEDMEMAREAGQRISAEYIALGLARQNSGDPDAAVEFYDKSVVVGWGHPEAFYHRGVANVARGNPAAALRDFRRFLELAPGDVRVEDARRRISNLRLLLALATPTQDASSPSASRINTLIEDLESSNVDLRARSERELMGLSYAHLAPIPGG